MNVIGFIDKYGDSTFEEFGVTILDYLIFSEIAYLDFDGIVSSSDKTKITLGHAAYLYLNKYNESYFRIQCTATKSALKILKAIRTKPRYLNLKMYNYRYECSHDLQFSAFMVDLTDKLKVISFEGTDDLISGWKEDFAMSYQFPVPAQKLAIQYVNSNIKFIDKSKYVICGHSKGGNLALTSAMYTNLLKQHNIKEIYSFDGPGLDYKKIYSFRYNMIYKKYTHIVPDSSIFGLLFYDRKYTVIKSSRRGLLGHDGYTWQIKGNDFLYTEISGTSESFYATFNEWLARYDKKQREYLTEQIFAIFDRCNIKSIVELNEHMFSYIKDLIDEISNIDKDTKDMLKALFKLMISNSKEMLLSKIQDKISIGKNK
jgi:hypothetical protein